MLKNKSEPERDQKGDRGDRRHIQLKETHHESGDGGDRGGGQAACRVEDVGEGQRREDGVREIVEEGLPERGGDLSLDKNEGEEARHQGGKEHQSRRDQEVGKVHSLSS